MTRNLSAKQWTFCISYGLALWVGAMFLVRAMGSWGALSDWGFIIAFVLLVPATWPAVALTARVMGAEKGQLLIGVSIISTIALLLAGIGFAFFPHIYGSDPTSTVRAAGFILWGGGIGFVLALMMDDGA